MQYEIAQKHLFAISTDLLRSAYIQNFHLERCMFVHYNHSRSPSHWFWYSPWLEMQLPIAE